MRWTGQEPLEAGLQALVDAGKRREVAAACVAIANASDAVEVDGLDGALDLLQRWVLGSAADLAAAVDAADGIAMREYNDYASSLDGTPISYAKTARATVVLLGCRVALARAITVEDLAYNALSALCAGGTPQREHVETALELVRSAME